MDWQLADAKNRFSELFTRALTDGPQHVRRRHQSVVVVAEAAYQRLTGHRRSFKDYLMHGPSFAELDLTRDPSPSRDVAL
jgi:antitoxin Phd